MAWEEKELPSSGEIVHLASFEQEWLPADYLNEFYQYPQVVDDEIEAVKHQLEFARTHLSLGQTVLEFGSGPTAHRALAVAPYVKEIHMADYLQPNLGEVQRWVQGDGHSWRHYTRYILQLEGIKEPTEDQIAERENMARTKITTFFQADAGFEDPLGVERRGIYEHVYSGFCADSATGSKIVWTTYMRNIASLVAPGGTFWVGALRKAEFYRSGNKYFPSANIDEDDLRKVLELDFISESISIEARELPNMEEHGYQGILLAHARKKR